MKLFNGEKAAEVPKPLRVCGHMSQHRGVVCVFLTFLKTLPLGCISSSSLRTSLVPRQSLSGKCTTAYSNTLSKVSTPSCSRDANLCWLFTARYGPAGFPLTWWDRKLDWGHGGNDQQAEGFKCVREHYCKLENHILVSLKYYYFLNQQFNKVTLFSNESDSNPSVNLR